MSIAPKSWTPLKIVTGIAAIAGVVLLLKHLASRIEDSNQKEINTWVNGRLAEDLSTKLNQPVQQILVVLQSPTTSPLKSEIKQIVQSVDLLFFKESFSQITMKLCILYKDGSRFFTKVDKEWESLPRIIRNNFLKNDSRCVRVPWEFSVTEVRKQRALVRGS